MGVSRFRRAASSGNYSSAASSGNSSSAASSGNKSIAVGVGYNCLVKSGPFGCVVAFYDDGTRPRACVGYVGEGDIKADTWYKATAAGLAEVK